MDFNNLLSLFSNLSSNSQQPQKEQAQVALYPQDFSSNSSTQNFESNQKNQTFQSSPNNQTSQNNMQQNFSNLLPVLAMLFGKEKANLGQLFSNLPALSQFKPFFQLFNSKKEEKESSPSISSYKKIEE